VTTLLVDTSVLLKWFHTEGETDLTEARSLRDSAKDGEVQARVIDLAFYEMGNILLSGLGWKGSDIDDQLDDLVVICGPPLAMAADWFRRAAVIGDEHRLTLYDAAWAAAAEALGVSLISADTQLLEAGLAESRGRHSPPSTTTWALTDRRRSISISSRQGRTTGCPDSRLGARSGQRVPPKATTGDPHGGSD
jgi:predicted nucleic acid-binding protein